LWELEWGVYRIGGLVVVWKLEFFPPRGFTTVCPATVRGLLWPLRIASLYRAHPLRDVSLVRHRRSGQRGIVQYARKSSGRTIAVRYENGMELCEAGDVVVEG
jgi:hypothetical protein